jgi:hypothetical protein
MVDLTLISWFFRFCIGFTTVIENVGFGVSQSGDSVTSIPAMFCLCHFCGKTCFLMICHWFFFKMTSICHQLEDLSIKLASWTLWNFAGWPKCLTKIITHEWHDSWVIKSMPKSDSEIGTFFLWLIQPWFHDFSDFQLFFIGNVGFGVSQSLAHSTRPWQIQSTSDNTSKSRFCFLELEISSDLASEKNPEGRAGCDIFQIKQAVDHVKWH